MADRPRVTATLDPVVWIQIRGERTEPFPACRQDGGLVGDLVPWLGREGISYWSSVSTAGHFVALFMPADAERVRAWLAERGVELGTFFDYSDEGKVT